MKQNKRYFIGIDVQVKRPCPYAVMSESHDVIEQGWIKGTTLKKVCDSLIEKYPEAYFGIDAPRMPINKPRQFYWDKNQWRIRRQSDKGLGRHCEVVIAAHKLAKPQWTPLSRSAPDWMKLGFRFFKTIEKERPCFEVFPSASYRMLDQLDTPKINLNFSDFLPGPKDMLDAVIAALTVKQFVVGNGMEVGGGDGKGTIILPVKIDETDIINDVLHWPDDTSS